VSLDRQSIEKRDFPIGRRGYEPEAVDAHLRALAAEVEGLQQQGRKRSGASLASAASDQVRLIVQAAESSAAEIEQEARDEAAKIRDEAAGEAESTRHDAIERSRAHVSRVDDASTLMLQRVDAMESELSALAESLRTGANRLTADLSLLQGNMGELYDAAGGDSSAPRPAPSRVPNVPRPAPVKPAAPVETEAEYDPQPQAVEELVVEETHVAEVAAQTPPEPAPAPDPVAEAPVVADDSEGARLVALDMALSGKDRGETDKYLAEHYDLADRAGLLDEVYASI
jgi:hypothetical protein